MPLTTRRAVPGDAAELHGVAARTFELACPPGTLRSDIDAYVTLHLSEKRFEEYLKDSSRIVLLAELDLRPVGYAMLVRGPLTDPDVRAVVDDGSIELSKFYVLADNHGSGVAGELMRATLEAAADTGATSCWLGVNQRNVRAAKFYAKHGFEVAGTKRFQLGAQWHDDYIRLRPLP
jgi:diamine N-acetyltransferase